MIPRFTHYTYLTGPNNHREPTGMVNLTATSVTTRRRLIHQLNQNGELLAQIPFSGVVNMMQLRQSLGLT